MENNSNDHLSKPPTITLGEVGTDDHPLIGKSLSSPSSSSSSSSSSSGDPFELDLSELSQNENRIQLALDNYVEDHDIPISSMPPLDNTHQYPPTQVMDRGDDDSAPSSSYRIPASVFETTKGPTDWSVASNESLFSIYMGNMSFTKDHVYWLGKSGELGNDSNIVDFSSNQPPSSSKPNELIDFSSNQPPPPPRKSMEVVDKRNTDLAERFGVTETTAADTMREVLRENDDARNKKSLSQNKDATSYLESISRRSDVSGASVRSFAFPQLSEDVNKSGPLMVDNEKWKQQSTLQPEAQHPKLPSDSKKVTQPEPLKNEESNKAEQQNATTNEGPCKWLSCFSRCRFCC